MSDPARPLLGRRHNRLSRPGAAVLRAFAKQEEAIDVQTAGLRRTDGSDVDLSAASTNEAAYRRSAFTAGGVDDLNAFKGGRVVLNRFGGVEEKTTKALDVAALPGAALAALLRAAGPRSGDRGALREALGLGAALGRVDVRDVGRLDGKEAVAFALNLYHLLIAHGQLEGCFACWAGDRFRPRDRASDLRHRLLPPVGRPARNSFVCPNL